MSDDSPSGTRERRAESLTNRRQYRRSALSVSVLVDTGRSYHTGRARDVSEGGLRVELDSVPPLGATVEVCFELEKEAAIETQAKVVWIEDHAVGLQFEAISEAESSALRGHCDRWRKELLQRAARNVSAETAERPLGEQLLSAARSTSR